MNLIAMIKAFAGNVYGPASGTDNQIVRLDGTSGKKIQGTTGLTADDSGNLTANAFLGDGSDLTNIGEGAETVLTLLAKVNEAAGISIGQAVYISGATGQFPQVSLTDNTNSAKYEWVGLAAETKANSQNILIRIRGIVQGMDTSQGGSWSDGDKLYLTTGGNLTNVRPTSGTVQHVGHVAYAHASQGKIHVAIHNENYIAAAASEDIDLRMGDAAGATKVAFEDYADNEIGSVDSNGNATFETVQVNGRKVMPKTLDTAGINAAIDALGATGGELYLPPGDYDITAASPIDYDRTKVKGGGSGTRILCTGRLVFDASAGTLSEGDTVTGSIGAGTAVVVKIDYTNGILWYNERSGTDFVDDEVLSSGGNTVTVNGSPTDGTGFLNIGSMNDVEVSDLMIIGGSSDQSGTAIAVNGGDRPSIHDIIFKEPNGYVVDFQNSESFKFKNNTLNKTIANASVNVRFSSDTNCFGVIEGNVLRHSGLGDVIVLDSESHYVVVADNTIEGGRWPIWAQGDHAVISNNNCYNSNNAITVEGDHCVVEGNTNDSDANEGIKITGSHCTVSDNVLFNCGKYAIYVTGAGATYCAITGNTIYDTGATYSDILVSGGAHFASIVGNVCHGDEVGTAGYSGISVSSSNHVLIDGNICDNHNTTGIEIANSADVMLGHNNVESESTPYTLTSPTDLQETVLIDGRTAPAATVGLVKLFVDSADGDLKVIFGDGTTKTIVTDA